MIFSVIVPAYNVEKYLMRCMDAILSQTLKDYEIIIIDDGSTDHTGQIADQIRSLHPEFIRVIHQENRGLGGARNSGLEESKGEYLVFIDSDDYIRKDFLEKTYEYLIGEQLDILVFGMKQVSDEEKIEGKSDDSSDNFRIIDQKEYLITGGPSAWNKIYRKSVFILGNIRYPEKLIYEDIATTPMTALCAERIGVIDSELYYYVQRPGSIITSPNIDRIFEIQKGFDRVIEYFRGHDAMGHYYSEIELLAIIHIFYFTDIRIIMAGGKKEVLEKTEDYIENIFPDFRRNPYLSDQIFLMKNGIEIELLKLFFNHSYRKAKQRYFPFVKTKRVIKNIIFRLHHK